MTVLAFISIPVTPAPSIFGTNIQQITSTGHSLWPFFYTSAALLILPGVVFYFRLSIQRALTEAAVQLAYVSAFYLAAFPVVTSMFWKIVGLFRMLRR